MFQLDPVLDQDTFLLAHLPLCEMLLMNDSQYPWVILVPRSPNLRELIELSDQQTAQLNVESRAVSQMLMRAFHADKLNIAALGNVVAQLHIHHIARFVDDAVWPKPVWGALPAKAYSSTELTQVSQRVRDNFSLPAAHDFEWDLGG